MRLTDLQIQKLPIPDKGQKTYWEGGFGVRVSQGGSKTFVVMYGKERRLRSIGRYPALTLKIARQDAQKLLADQSDVKVIKTLAQARTAFIDDCKKRLRDSTWKNYERILNTLDQKHLADVVKADLNDTPHRTMTGKVFFNWCVDEGLVDKNPFARERVKYGKRTRLLTDAEIKLIWHYDAPPFSDHLKALILTGQRRTQFSDFELRGDTIYFSAEVMKGKEAHIIPLLPMAKEVLERIKPSNAWSKNKAKMDTKVEIPAWVIHDFRRYFSTTMAKLKVPLHVTETILAHRSGQVSGIAAIYNLHDFLAESRSALRKFEKHIAKVVG